MVSEMKKYVKKISLVVFAVSFVALALNSCASSNVEGNAPDAETNASQSVFSKEEFIASVKDLSKNSEYEKALEKYSEIPSSYQKKYADDYELNLLKLRLYELTGRLTQAKSLADKMLLKNKNNEELKKIKFSIEKKLFMAELQDALKNQDENAALELYEDIDSAIAEDFNINLIKASLLVSANRFDEAENLCKKLEAADKSNVEVMEIRLAIAEKKGDNKEKQKQLKAIVAKDPYNAPANIQLGESAALNKNYKQAKNYYLKALAKESRNEDALFGYGQMDYYLENDEKATETFNKLLEINPQNPQAYSYLAKLAYADDKFQIAIANVEKALQIDDSNGEYYMNYGLYLRSAGRFADAENAWTKAIEIMPEYFLPYAYRAGLYDEQDKFPQALADYQKVIQLNPEYYYAYESIGVLALHEKDYKTAGDAFFNCRKYNQENISYPLMVTYCYYMMNNKSEGKNYSGKILPKIKGAPNSIEYKMLRVYHDEAGHNSLPQEIARLTNVNDRGKMYFYLGLFYQMYGSTEAANEMFAKVINMNSPMFFEYRLAEWAIEANKADK